MGERIVVVGKEVWGGGRLWMRRVNVGILIAVKGVWDFARL